MINQDPNPAPASSWVTSVTLPPVGGIAQVFRSGDAYKAVGESVQRSVYPELSAAFPRNGAVNSKAVLFPDTAIDMPIIAYGNGNLFVAGQSSTVGGTSAVVSKDSGASWFKVTLPVSATWRSIIFGFGIFVLFGTDSQSANCCITSPDGVTWTVRSAPPSVPTALAYNGSIMVSVTAGTTSAMSSTDGITWTARTMPSQSGWLSIAYGGGKFLAVSNSGGIAATSTNGTSWSAVTIPIQASMLCVTFGAGVFVLCGASGYLFTSTDTITWTQRVVPPEVGAQYYCVLFSDGVFVLIGSGTNRCGISYNGSDWISKAALNDTTTKDQNTAAFCLGAFVFLNRSTSTTTGVSGRIIYAENLTDSDWLYLSGTAGQFVRVK